jgi:hypothetical protein
MTDARARIHAMFPLDRASERELDIRLDAYRAEVLVTDGQAYDGELAMLRGLVRTLRVVVRPDDPDVAEVQRLLIEHARDETAARAEEKATASAATATPDFFQAGHTYRRDEDGTLTHPFVWVFEVRSIETHPDGTRYAFGFLTSKGGGNSLVPHSEWEKSWPDGWASSGWTDITEGGTHD